MMADTNNSHLFNNPPSCNHKHTLFCFDPDCTNQRLFCSDCLPRLKHQGHKIAFINASVEPLSRLSSHCYLPNAKSIYSSLQKKAITLSQSLQSAQSLASSIFSTIRKRLLDPIWTITNTYSKQMSERAVHTLLKDASNTQEIEIIVSKINYLLNLNDSIENHLQKADTIEEQAKNMIRETFLNLQKMQENIDRQINSARRAERNCERNKKYEKLLAEKSEKIMKELQESKDFNELLYNQKNLMHKVKQRLQASIKAQDREMNEEKPYLLQTRSKGRIRQHSPEKVQEIEQKKPKRKPGPKPKKKEEEIEEQGSYKYEQYQEVNRTIINPPDASSRPSAKESEISESEEINEGEQIEWTVSADHQIQSLSPYIYNKITSLIIESIPSQPAELFGFIKELKHLKELHIFDNLICVEENILNLMQVLPRSLRKLYFNCSNEFNRNCIKRLFKKKMKKLTHLSYFYNIHELLRRVDQSLYFRDKAQGVRVQPLDSSDTNYLISCFPSLKNLWLRIKNYSRSKRNKTAKYNELQHLIVGELQEEEEEKQMEICDIPPKLRQHLMETHSLKSLVLLNVQLMSDEFIKVVLQNQDLETLYIEQCNGLNQEVLRKIGKETKVVNYSFKECQNITGAFIQQVPQANIFVLDHLKLPPTSNPPMSPYNSFRLCHKLTYFNVYANPFFNDHLLESLSNSFTSLRSLNIGYTLITDACAPFFKHLVELQCLCLDENLISASGIYQICSPLTKLIKLSLCGYNGEKEKGQISSALLNDLGTRLSNIQHLSLRNCCKIGDDFDLKDFHNLKIVETDKKVGQLFISTLKFGGVKVYDETEEEI